MNDLARLFSFGDLLGLAEHYAEFNQRYPGSPPGTVLLLAR